MNYSVPSGSTLSPSRLAGRTGNITIRETVYDPETGEPRTRRRYMISSRRAPQKIRVKKTTES